MAGLELHRIEKTFADGTRAVKPLDLTVEDGELMVLVGPSGCGKSTILRLVAGLETETAGTIRIGDRDVAGWSPRRRNVAMVFQNYALYPHLTVRKNLEFPLRMARVPRAERRRRVERVADLLGLAELLGRRPARLSGGQRQRVAMGRAIVREPDLFLMDEPLSNLDAELRVRIRTEIAALQRRLGTTTVYVTHDQVEAMTLGHRVAVLKAGVLQQVAPPRDLYDRPATAFVASFLGSPGMNLVPARALGEEGDGSIGFRPEDLLPAGEATDDALLVSVHVTDVEALGHEQIVHGRLRGTDRPVAARFRPGDPVEPGQGLDLAVRPESLRRFDAEGRAV
jgi:multiple sugar transport system ATP-binding protein